MARLTSSSWAKVAAIVALILLIFLFAAYGGSRGIASLGPVQTGNASVNASDVQDIDIDWAAGSVNIETYDGSTIELTETSRNLTKAQEMKWSVSGGMLKIDYGKGIGCVSAWDKELTVKIPKALADDLGSLDIDGASGSYTVNDLTLDKIKIDLASGNFTGKNVVVDDLDVNAASGTVIFNGEIASKVKLDVASGKFDIMLHKVCPKTIKASLASGNITIGLPENDGFTATVDAVSGDFSSEFETTRNGKAYLYKQGSPTTIDADMISGRLNIVRS